VIAVEHPVGIPVSAVQNASLRVEMTLRTTLTRGKNCGLKMDCEFGNK